MTSLTQKSIGCGHNECIVQDNLHVKPDLPATACQGTHSPVTVHSGVIVALVVTAACQPVKLV